MEKKLYALKTCELSYTSASDIFIYSVEFKVPSVSFIFPTSLKDMQLKIIMLAAFFTVGFWKF